MKSSPLPLLCFEWSLHFCLKVVTLSFNLLILESLLSAFFCEQSCVLDISPRRVAIKYKRWCLTSQKVKIKRLRKDFVERAIKNLIMRPKNNYLNTTDCTLSSTQEGHTLWIQLQPAEKTLQEDKNPLITLTRSKSSSRTRIDSSFLWAIRSFLSSIPIFSVISSSSVSPIFRSLFAFLFSSLE